MDSNYDSKFLMERARKAKELAHCPESGFQVGSAVLTENGEIFTGCNIENASYGATNCAERTAIFKAVSEGHKSFKAIALSSSNSSKPVYPCGICRQVMAEFNPKMIIHIDGDEKLYTVEELLPKYFSSKQIS